MPGQRYSTDGPLLMYPGLAVERRGGYAHRLSWAVPEFADFDQERAWVIGQVTAAIDATAAAAAVAAAAAAVAAPVVIGGTADQFWDGRTARMVTPHVLEVEDADHGMLVPGALSASAAVLGRVITAVEDFLDHVAWRR